jgi:hypothetical protein
MDCPKCGLVNPASAARCDCGYDFTTKQMEASYLETTQNDRAERHRMLKHVNAIAYVSLFVGGVYLLLLALGVFFYITETSDAKRVGLPEVIVIGVLGLPSLFIGIGLKKRKSWARVTTIVLAVISIFNPVSWYVLWVLTRPATKQLFALHDPSLA